MDCVLIQDGKAHQIWPDTTKQALCFKVHDGETEPRAVFPRATIDTIVEVQGGTVVPGAVYADEVFISPPAPRRMVRKSLIVERLNAAGLLAAAKVALDADLYARERWYAPDRPSVYADDAEALALLKAIGADPAVILAI